MRGTAISTAGKLFGLLRFALFYMLELVLSNLRVAHDILTPRARFRPAIIAVDLPELTDTQLITLVNLVTMTPGTLCLDVASDRSVLFLHCMYVDDPEEFRGRIRRDYVLRIKELLP